METSAYYLHIVDTLETAEAFVMRIRSRGGKDPAFAMDFDFHPYSQLDVDALVRIWLPLTCGVKSLNRAWGCPTSIPSSSGRR